MTQALSTTATIEINDKFREALHLLEETDHHVFITGRAGTGKSTLLNVFRNQTKKTHAILAPTGVAAVNIQGETIHSFFRFKPGVTFEEAKQKARRLKPDNAYQRLDLIIIDEASMVRADLLDCVDTFLQIARKNRLSFGGIQMAFIGDLYQLPPVVVGEERAAMRMLYDSPYFFDALVLKRLSSETADSLKLIELEKIYRQSDERFITLLNAVRNRTISEEEVMLLNQRVGKDAEITPTHIYLTATNAQADAINEINLAQLSGKAKMYQGERIGDFPNSFMPTDEILKLKKDARVMFLNNDQRSRWINGTMGTVTKLGDDYVVVRIDGGEDVEVNPFTWTVFQTRFDDRARTLVRDEMGAFTQLPLMLAWAITIHKSQGKTFDQVVIDIGRGTFASGQMYVALSRCRTMDGMIFKQPLKRSHILMDWRVVKFLTSFQYAQADKAHPKEEKIAIIKKAIEQKAPLAITYLKSSDVKSKRTILPLRLEEMEYKGYAFTGVEAYCFSRKENRIFRVEKILEIQPHEKH